MNIDWIQLAFWLQALQFSVTCVAAAYAWVAMKSRVTATRINELQKDIDDRLDDHSKRITRVEVFINRCAQHDRDFSRLVERVHNLGESVSQMSGRLEILTPIQEQLSRINDWLMKRP